MDFLPNYTWPATATGFISSEMNTPTVVVCTHNPDLQKLTRVMQAINFSEVDFQFNKVLIDNGSTNSYEIVKLSELNQFDYYFEEKIGLSYARYKAMSIDSANLLIFIDDDNYVNTQFISQALKFYSSNPDVYVFGGKALPVNTPKRKWKREMLQFLGAKDLGDETKISKSSHTWQLEEPIGAGLCLNPIATQAFLELETQKLEFFFALGRSGNSLKSGEDGFISRFMAPAGKIAYVPDLQLWHDIGFERLRPWYLIKLMFNYGVSDSLLEDALSINHGTDKITTNKVTLNDYVYFLKQLNIKSFFNSIRILGYLFQRAIKDYRKL